MPAQTPDSYDEMPYINRAFPQTHPDRLAALARLFGLEAPDVETCRVLELGCASGDNLLPMALGLPGARFVGIDFSLRQVEQGRRAIAALGLANIELRHADITTIDASLGRFDYIVCHGIYSWVPPPVREKVLAICKQNLAPAGVAFVSYNTYPGWHLREMVRDMMVYHAAPVAGAKNKVAQARSLLEFLGQNLPADTPYGNVLREEAALVRGEDDAYLFHDHLEADNHPVYFHQFAQAAKDNGLQYLAEADFSSMLPTNFPPPMATALRQISGDVVRLEQYMDFFRARSFRQTLLTHAGREVQRKLEPQAMQSFHFASPAVPTTGAAFHADGVAETFRAPQGAKLTTRGAIVKAAMLVLAEAWPQALPFAELAQAARAKLDRATGAAAAPARAAQDNTQLCNSLLQSYAVNVVELRLRSPRLAATPSARPRASPLARWQAGEGLPLTNLRHEPVKLDEANRQVLRLLDGTRDRAALVAAMTQLARDGVLAVQPDGRPPPPGPQLEQILREGLEENLPHFARAALLVE